jgi:hypothetical protein
MERDEPFLTTWTELYSAILVGISGEHGPVPENHRIESAVRLAVKSSQREHAPIEPNELLRELKTLRWQREHLAVYCDFVDGQNRKDSKRTLHTRIIRRLIGEPEPEQSGGENRG